METAVVALGISLVALHALQGALSCSRIVSLAICADFARRPAWRVPVLVSPGRQAPPDFSSRLVDHKVEARRAAGARTCYVITALLMCVVNASVLINVAYERQRWMTRWQTFIALVMHAVFLLINATPALTHRLKDVYYGLSMVLLAAFIWCASPDHFMFSSVFVYGLRMMLSLVNLKMRHVLVWNLLALGTVFAYAVHSFPGGDLFDMICILETYNTLVILIVGAAFQYWNVRELRQQIQVGILSSENSASMSLLDMVCDVVIELRDDLALARDSRAMAAFLMRSSKASLAGVPFCDFMSEESERQRFRDSVSAAVMGPEASVGTCHVQLSDSLCNVLSAEVFIVKVSMLGDDCRYILGIREFTDGITAMPSFGHAERRPRPCRKPAQKGTPPSSEYLDLQTRDSPETRQSTQPVCPTEVGKREASRYPDLVPTGRNAMCRGIVMAMSTWNASVPGTACCPFHAYAMEARAMVRSFSQVCCVADYPGALPNGTQCQECGTIWPGDEKACSMCDSAQLRLLPGSARRAGRTVLL